MVVRWVYTTIFRVKIRLAAILLGIDANELNNVFASWHLIILKIGKIGNYLSSSKYAFVIPKKSK